VSDMGRTRVYVADHGFVKVTEGINIWQTGVVLEDHPAAVRYTERLREAGTVDAEGARQIRLYGQAATLKSVGHLIQPPRAINTVEHPGSVLRLPVPPGFTPRATPATRGRRVSRFAEHYREAIARVTSKGGRRAGWREVTDQLNLDLDLGNAPLDESTIRRWVREDGLPKPWHGT